MSKDAKEKDLEKTVLMSELRDVEEKIKLLKEAKKKDNLNAVKICESLNSLKQIVNDYDEKSRAEQTLHKTDLNVENYGSILTQIESLKSLMKEKPAVRRKQSQKNLQKENISPNTSSEESDNVEELFQKKKRGAGASKRRFNAYMEEKRNLKFLHESDNGEYQPFFYNDEHFSYGPIRATRNNNFPYRGNRRGYFPRSRYNSRRW